MTLVFILAAALAGGLVSVLLAAGVLALQPAAVERWLPRLVSFSTGSLLGAALLGMIPHAAANLSVRAIATTVLTGLVAFFVMERLLLWRHCHKQDCHVHANSGPLLLVGDAFHNFVDGVVVAGAFLDSTSLGLMAAVSIIAHEVPQELGEFMVYLHEGYTRKRALLLNTVTSLTSVMGAVLGYFFLSAMRHTGPYLMAFAAAGLLYVALADLIPAQRGTTTLRLALCDFGLLVLGIAVIGVVTLGH